jgi:hypothetical protein
MSVTEAVDVNSVDILTVLDPGYVNLQVAMYTVTQASFLPIYEHVSVTK